MDYINQIILGNALYELPKLPSELVSCVVTSPPYWSLRDYGVGPVIWDGDKNCKHIWDNKTITLKHKSGETNPGKEGWFKDKGASDDKGNCFCLKCGAWRGSLGLEPTFELYIKHLCDIFDEVKPVLRKDGTCFVNMGDTYGGSTGQPNAPKLNIQQVNEHKSASKVKEYLPAKSLCLIPQRFVIEMVNRGWILRNTIIWHKPNCMPSSAKDRFTVDFEYVYFFTKNKKYWFEQQFDDFLSNDYDRNRMAKARTEYGGKWAQDSGGSIKTQRAFVDGYAQGRNKRAVWTIPTSPFPEAHFAIYPEALIEPMIKAGCPEFVCKKCGKARVKIYEKGNLKAGRKQDDIYAKHTLTKDKRIIKDRGWNTEKGFAPGMSYEQKFKGYTDCGCNAGFEGGITLDPFMGAGTTALVALKQRKRFIGIEIKQEYIDMAYKRIAKIQQKIF